MPEATVLPLQPVLDLLPPTHTPEGDEISGATLSNASVVLGIGHNRLRRWAEEGLTVYEADDLAAGKLRFHPIFIWADAWEAAVAPACQTCEEEIPSGRSPQAKRCSNRCTWNATKRSRRAKVPA